MYVTENMLRLHYKEQYVSQSLIQLISHVTINMYFVIVVTCTVSWSKHCVVNLLKGSCVTVKPTC
jgi:hypothetical protein